MQNKKSGRITHSSPAQLANLKTFGKMDPELQKEWQRRGAIRAAEVKHEKFIFRKSVEWLANMPAFEVGNEVVEKLRAKFPDLNNAQAMSVAVMAKAIIDGDPKAYAVLRDTIGEIPSQNVNVNGVEPMQITITTVD